MVWAGVSGVLAGVLEGVPAGLLGVDTADLEGREEGGKTGGWRDCLLLRWEGWNEIMDLAG